MKIADVLNKIKKELDPELQYYKFLQTESFEKSEDNGECSSCTVDLIIEKSGHNVMAITYAENEEEEIKAYSNYKEYNPASYFYVVLRDGMFSCKERPYIMNTGMGYKPKSLFDFGHIPPSWESTRTIKINLEELVDIIKKFDVNYYKRIPVEESCEFFNRHSGSCDIKTFVDSLKESDMHFNNEECFLKPEAESRFMSTLLNDKELPACLYRYSSSAIINRIFEGKECKHSMSSLIVMNDTTEVDYANRYLERKKVDLSKQVLAEERNKSIHAYITSLSVKGDDLTMWRLYGDNAKGVCMAYSYKKEDIDTAKFMLAYVSYADEDGNDKKLDFVVNLMKSSIGKRKFRLRNWHIWQHFFKPKEYSIEQEVRLLVFADELDISIDHHERKWIITSDGIMAPLLLLPLKKQNEREFEYPLTINGIIFGSKFTEKEANRITWEYKITNEYNACVGSGFKIKISKINNYR